MRSARGTSSLGQLSGRPNRNSVVLIPDVRGVPYPFNDGRALCVGHGHPPGLWSPDAKDVDTRERAKAICRRCPVQPDCLAYAHTFRKETLIWGVWGGCWFTDRGIEEGEADDG